MYFDGSHSNNGSGVGIFIISSSEEYFLFSLKLQFTCTNNIAESETLLLGLEATQTREIQQLIIIGDSYLVISQIRGNFETKDEKLKPYGEIITNVTKDSKELQLLGLDRFLNNISNSLAIATSTSSITHSDIAKIRKCIFDIIH